MSLNVYLTREEVPSGMTIIDSSDIHFNAFGRLTNSEFEKNVLKEVDLAEYNSESTFIGRTKKLGGLFIDKLSTGTKTLLNIVSFPRMCFNVIECGRNSLEFLCDLHEGNVLWERPVLLPMRDDESCDIMCRGIHFTNIYDFLDYEWEE